MIVTERTWKIIFILAAIACVAIASTACDGPTPTKSPPPTPTIESPLATPQAVDAVGRVVVLDELKSEEETNTMDNFAVLLTAAAFLSLVANRLVEGLVTPLFDKFKWDKFALMYIAWGIGCALTIASGINLFADIPGVAMAPMLGLVLSGLVAGGGSNFLHELFGTLGQRKARPS